MVHVAQLVLSPPARSETFIVSQLTGLLEREVKVTLCPRFTTGESACIKELLEHPRFAIGASGIEPRGSIYGSCCSFVEVMTARQAQIPLLRAWIYPGTGGFRRGVPYLYKCLDAIKPDLIHCQFGTLAQSVSRLNELGLVSAPMLVSIRGWDISQALRRRGRYLYLRPFRQKAFFLPVSNYFARKLIELGCPVNRIRVLRSGIVLRNFEFSPRFTDAIQELHLVCIGRFVEKKGLSDAIEALRLLSQDGRKVRMTIVGWGALESDLRKQAVDAGVIELVSFVGQKSHPEVIEIMRDANVFIAPSITADDGDEEGIPNVLKEAMATGVPVISTRHSGIPELVQDGITGFLVNQRKPTEIAEAVVKLCEMPPDRRRQMCEAARKLVEKEYDSEAITSRLMQIYSEILDSSAERC